MAIFFVLDALEVEICNVEYVAAKKKDLEQNANVTNVIQHQQTLALARRILMIL